MRKIIRREFKNRDAIGTPEVAQMNGISEATARALAPEIGVAKVGPAYAWTRQNVEDLIDRLEADDDDDEADDDDLEEEEDLDDDDDEDEDEDEEDEEEYEDDEDDEVDEDDDEEADEGE